MNQLLMSTAPKWMPGGTSSVNFTNQNMNTLGDKIGIAFTLEEDATIVDILMRQGASTTYNGTVRVSIQTVSATTGINSGTYVGGASNYVDITSWNSANNGAFLVSTPASAMSLTAGTPYMVVAEVTAAPTAGNTLTMSSVYANITQRGGYPYFINQTTTGIGSKGDNSLLSCFGLRSSTKTYGYPYEAFHSSAINTGSTPDEWGMGFTMPTSVCKTFEISMWEPYLGFTATTDTTFDVVIYQGTTALQTSSFDTAQMQGYNRNMRHSLVMSGTPATLSSGVEYIIALKPTTTTNITIYGYTFATSNDKTALGDLSFKNYTRTNAGAWSETTTRVPFGDICFANIQGGGGLKVHPGMTGGIRG